MLDPDELRVGLATGLRPVGAPDVLSGDTFAVAAGVGGSTMPMSVDRPTGHGRNRATMGRSTDTPARALPDESVSAAAFGLGADEVAHTLATAVVVEAFTAR